MKKTIMTMMLCLCTIACLGFTLPAELTNPAALRKPIVQKEIVPGLTYFRAEYDNLFKGFGKYELNILVIEWNKNKDLGLQFWQEENLWRHKPSEALAKNPLGVACINGFYHIVYDPSMTYFPLKIDGVEYAPWVSHIEMVVAFDPFSPLVLGNSKAKKALQKRSYAGTEGCPGKWPVQPKFDYTDDAKRKSWDESTTFVGNNTNENITIMCVADGYNPGVAQGMNYAEMTWLMQQFKVPHGQIVTFDSGGSSVMAVKDLISATNMPVRVVSYPRTDHKVFGERNVLTSLQIVVRDPKKYLKQK